MVMMTPIVLFSLTIHEYSHGRVAFMLGDPTAKLKGRLSFNPLKHLDPIGVLFFYFVGFGWAKPVPVDPRNFMNPRKDLMYVSLAGPFANIVLALICGFFIRMTDPNEHMNLFYLLTFGVYINVALAVFNMLPVFPLDGAGVIKGLVSPAIALRLHSLDKISGFILLGVFLMDHFLHTGILWYAVGYPVMLLVELLTQEAFPLIQQVLFVSFR
jgi:Zn-dependent protease